MKDMVPRGPRHLDLPRSMAPAVGWVRLALLRCERMRKYNLDMNILSAGVLSHLLCAHQEEKNQ